MRRHSPLVERAIYHLARARAWARRATRLGLAVRGTVWLTGTAALLLAAPPSMRTVALLPVAVLVALPAAAGPGSGWVTLVELIAIVGVAAAPDSVWRILSLAAVLYLHHTAAALGAALRTDAVIPRPVLRRWAERAGVVLAVSLPVGLGIAVLAGQAPAGPATGYLALGLAAAVALALLLAARSRSYTSVEMSSSDRSHPPSR
jgi:hypothetical protein